MPFGLSIENWITIILGVPVVAIIGYITKLVFVLNKTIKNLQVIPEIKLAIDDLTIEVKSIDYATAKQYGNGYMQHKAEKRQELTTEGGLNLKRNFKSLSVACAALLAKKIKVSLFVDPTCEAMELSARLKVDAVELHTGAYANAKNKKEVLKHFNEIKKSAEYAKSIQLNVFAGHGLTTSNLKRLTEIEEIEEYNIGHWIIARAVNVGLKKATQEILDLLK